MNYITIVINNQPLTITIQSQQRIDINNESILSDLEYLVRENINNTFSLDDHDSYLTHIICNNDHYSIITIK